MKDPWTQIIVNFISVVLSVQQFFRAVTVAGKNGCNFEKESPSRV